MFILVNFNFIYMTQNANYLRYNLFCSENQKKSSNNKDFSRLDQVKFHFTLILIDRLQRVLIFSNFKPTQKQDEPHSPTNTVESTTITFINDTKQAKPQTNKQKLVLDDIRWLFEKNFFYNRRDCDCCACDLSLICNHFYYWLDR